MEDGEKRALSCLPEHLKNAVIRTSRETGRKQVDEIRLRVNREMSVTAEGVNLLCGIRCSGADLEYTVEKLCQGSLYSHADSIREGVITSNCGIRAGVAGRAVVMNGRVECVRDIGSVCIRIPHRITGAADELLERIGHGGVLVWSPPGCGKTTVLRELIPRLARSRRVAVVDTRYELCVDEAGALVDWFAGYPRSFGIRSAIRTMSPEVIVCDEISGEEDAHSLMEAHNAGVMICASAHGRSVQEVFREKHMSLLGQSGVFSLIYGRTGRMRKWELIEQNSPVNSGADAV